MSQRLKTISPSLLIALIDTRAIEQLLKFNLAVKIDLVEVAYYFNRYFICCMINVLRRRRHYLTLPYYHRLLYDTII